MRGRNLLAVAVVGAVVVGLGVLRSALEAPTAGSAGDAVATGAQTAAPAAALPTLLDFGRGTCIPCKQMMPVLDTLARRHERQIEVHYMDLAEPENSERATALHVRVIPTQVLLAADGTEVGRHEGFWPLDEIEARFEELGWTQPD